jgi:hypothetical protein
VRIIELKPPKGVNGVGDSFADTPQKNALHP